MAQAKERTAASEAATQTWTATDSGISNSVIRLGMSSPTSASLCRQISALGREVKADLVLYFGVTLTFVRAAIYVTARGLASKSTVGSEGPAGQEVEPFTNAS